MPPDEVSRGTRAAFERAVVSVRFCEVGCQVELRCGHSTWLATDAVEGIQVICPLCELAAGLAAALDPEAA